MTRAAVLLGLLLVPGCSTGARQSSFARPGGEMVTVSLENGPELVGELMVVRPTGLVLRTVGIFEFPWNQIHEASFDRLGDVEWPERSIPSSATLGRLRLVSRFPQGLDEGTTRRLLDAYQQDAVEVCRVEAERLACEVAP
ncbi:hypothetical protein BH20GEM1_BH20GEM1_01330 [soil metagenome]